MFPRLTDEPTGPRTTALCTASIKSASKTRTKGSCDGSDRRQGVIPSLCGDLWEFGKNSPNCSFMGISWVSAKPWCTFGTDMPHLVTPSAFISECPLHAGPGSAEEGTSERHHALEMFGGTWKRGFPGKPGKEEDLWVRDTERPLLTALKPPKTSAPEASSHFFFSCRKEKRCIF